MATRMAVSLSRELARASRRFATLTQGNEKHERDRTE